MPSISTQKKTPCHPLSKSLHLTPPPAMYIPALLLLLPIGLAAAQDDIIYVTITAPPAPASTSYTDDSAFQNDMLAASNFYRREHGVADVAWDAQLAAVAADWAARCEFRHSDGPTGENLATGYPSVDSSVDAWGLERLAYDYDRPGFSEETGHFTQLVWSNTTRIGCGRRDCEGFDGGFLFGFLPSCALVCWVLRCVENACMMGRERAQVVLFPSVVLTVSSEKNPE